METNNNVPAGGLTDKDAGDLRDAAGILEREGYRMYATTLRSIERRLASSLHASEVLAIRPSVDLSGLTETQIAFAARAHANREADECGVNREDYWKLYGDDFVTYLRFMLEQLGLATLPAHQAVGEPENPSEMVSRWPTAQAFIDAHPDSYFESDEPVPRLHLAYAVDLLTDALDNAQAQQPAANRVDDYARQLAMHLWRTHYIKDAPEFELFDDTYGVLSQIDNMLTGLVRAHQAVGEPVRGAFLNKQGGVTLCQNGKERESFGFAGYLYGAPVPAVPAHQAVAAEGVKVLEGYKLVPVDPTPEMDAAGEDSIGSRGHCDCGNPNGAGASSIYSAMLAAAPVPPVSAAEQPGDEQAKRDVLTDAYRKLTAGAIGTEQFFDIAYEAGQRSHLARQKQAAPVAKDAADLRDVSAILEREGYRMHAMLLRQIANRIAAPTQGSTPQAERAAVPGGFVLVPTDINSVVNMGWKYLDAAREASPLKEWAFSPDGFLAAIRSAAAPVAQEAEQMGGAQAAPVGYVDVESVKSLCRDFSSRTGSVYIKDVEDSLDGLIEHTPSKPHGHTLQDTVPHQTTLDAIGGAILKGRMNVDMPPTPEHWLSEFWQIGRQLAEYGKTGIDNINPPDATPAASSESVDTPELQAIEERYLRAWFAWEDSPNKETGAAVGEARKAYIAHITSLIEARVAGVRKGQEQGGAA
jgi:hypothetical protein